VSESDAAITGSGAFIIISNPSEKLIKRLRGNITLMDVLVKLLTVFEIQNYV
jgi:hypothetical protein